MIVKPADRLQNVQEYYFSKKLEYIQQMRNRGIDVINLGIGSPDLAPPPQALKATAESVLRKDSHTYQSYRSTPELRNAMADWYERCYKVKLDSAKEILRGRRNRSAAVAAARVGSGAHLGHGHQALRGL